ncbi:MAG: SRPBCC family protein [Candidatus Dactylopiibacterium sp.]|nr:SRPBCC family protein [Candidatus Dactylopiibacterium sp.]
MPIEPALDLQITRLLRVPRARVWQAWADPGHLKAWWCPRPWVTEVRAFEFRAGGAFHTFMRGPDGATSDNPGAFLQIVPGERIVCTSMLLGDWRPAHDPWMPMSAIFTLADEAGGTRYTAQALHPSEEDRARHEEMGFHEGWGICIQQLEDYARTLVA